MQRYTPSSRPVEISARRRGTRLGDVVMSGFESITYDAFDFGKENLHGRAGEAVQDMWDCDQEVDGAVRGGKVVSVRGAAERKRSKMKGGGVSF